MPKKLSIEEVQHIADLARIGISEEEKQKFQGDLGSILDYIDKLQKIDVSGVESIANITGLKNQTREDDPAELGHSRAELDDNGSSKGNPKILMDMAPETKGGYVKVGKVLTK